MDIAILNQNLLLFINGLSGKNFLVDDLMIFGADYLIFIASLVVVLAFFKRRSQNKPVLFLTIISFAIAFVLLKLLGKFIFEPRPFVTLQIKPLIHTVSATSKSFPSDHTLVLAILAWSHFFYRTRLFKFLAVCLVWTGLARIYVGVHYPLDIVGGIILGLVAVALGWQVNAWILKKLPAKWLQ